VANVWDTGLLAHLGIRILEHSSERVFGEMPILDHLRNSAGSVHGGTLMAFADSVGSVGPAAMGLKSITIESKTNFLAAATSGKLLGEATPLHKGKRTHVWQTRVTDEAGKLLSITIQTQLIL
jgi:1,4-dihydroxy-2-naphthoyl-CoA hydrolase